MKTFNLVAASALIAATQAQNLFESVIGTLNDAVDIVSDATDVPLTQTVSKNKFGCIVEETIYSHPHTEKVIKAPLVPFHMDYTQQEAFLKEQTERHMHINANGPTPVATCADRAPTEEPSDFGMFLPVFAAQVNKDDHFMAHHRGRGAGQRQ